MASKLKHESDTKTLEQSLSYQSNGERTHSGREIFFNGKPYEDIRKKYPYFFQTNVQTKKLIPYQKKEKN